MLRCTQSRAARWSKKPRLWPVALSSGELGKPKTVTINYHSLSIFSKLTIGPVVGADHDDVLVCSEVATIVGRLSSVSKLQRTAIDPEHHRSSLASRCSGRSVYIQVQTVLRLLGSGVVKDQLGELLACEWISPRQQ